MTTGLRGRVVAGVDAIDPDHGAWITITADAALRRADQHDGGDLTGLIFGVKDLFDTAGVRTTYGSPLYADHVPTVTSSFVERIERRGAISLGKTNLNEFAYGVSGYNPTYGLMRSPLDPSRTAGGSSGGSAAAVAQGAVDFALGTDTSGSSRIPAACCGVIGLKLPHRSAAMDGVYALSQSRDSLGLLARDVDVIRRVLGVPGLPAAASVVTAPIREVGLPPMSDRHWEVFRAEAYSMHRDRANLHPESYGRDLVHKMSHPLTNPDQVSADEVRWRAECARAMGHVQVTTGPVYEGGAPTVEEIRYEYENDLLTSSIRLMAETSVASVLGWPAMSVPTTDGSVHLTARPSDLPALLSVAASIALTPDDQIAQR